MGGGNGGDGGMMVGGKRYRLKEERETEERKKERQREGRREGNGAKVSSVGRTRWWEDVQRRCWQWACRRVGSKGSEERRKWLSGIKRTRF